MPLEVEHLWGHFVDLTKTRWGNGYSGLPVSYQEIKAWADLTHVSLTPWEIRVLVDMDLVAIAKMSEKPGENRGKGGKDLGELRTEVAANDIHGVSSMMRGLAARAKAVYGDSKE